MSTFLANQAKIIAEGAAPRCT